MGSDDRQSVEASNPILGSLKVSGATVNTIFTVFTFMVSLGGLFFITQHYVEAKDNEKSNATIAKENNKALTDTLKESNAAFVRAIEALTIEQRRATVAAKEIACLNDPVMRNRADARDFCKRLVGDGR